MTNECRRVRPSIPAYLDGELDEERARPLRRHLMDCQPCRTATQGERALKRWFQAEAAAPIPAGFAARVARRAFAGDPGRESAPAPAATGAAGGEERGGVLLTFVLRATAAAAVLLIALAALLRSVELPSGSDLRAEDRSPPALEELLRDLDRLEAGAPAKPPSGGRPAAAREPAGRAAEGDR